MQDNQVNLQSDITLFLYGGLLLFLILSIFVVFIAFAYRKKQHQHLREKELLRQQFQTELLKSQLEIAEQTLQNIAQEIHDNIGQRLTLAALYIHELQCSDDSKRAATGQLVGEALQDLRNLSKNLSGNYVLDKGIEMAIERESEWINASGKMNCKFTWEGERHGMNNQQEIVLFRCVQEALTNAVKYSGAKTIDVHMVQSVNRMFIAIEDNGRGIEESEMLSGMGLMNIRQRIALLNGSFVIRRNSMGGTTVQLEFPTE